MTATDELDQFSTGVSICACGYEIPICEGCGREVNVDVDGGGWSGTYGRLCRPCFDLITEDHGRTCDKCQAAFYKRFPGAHVGWGNKHPVRHSDIVGHCVDQDLCHFLEGFNLNVAPTFTSCQGFPALPGAPKPGNWASYYGQPFVSCHGEHTATVLTWAASNNVRYGIASVSWTPPSVPWSSVTLRFGDTPTWLD